MFHLKVYLLLLTVLTALFAGAVADETLNRVSDAGLRDLKAISPLLPSADPGMVNSARYIRHRSLSAPGSAFPDFPGQPDYLPSGMMWPPPKTFVGLTDRPPIMRERDERQ